MTAVDDLVAAVAAGLALCPCAVGGRCLTVDGRGELTEGAEYGCACAEGRRCTVPHGGLAGVLARLHAAKDDPIGVVETAANGLDVEHTEYGLLEADANLFIGALEHVLRSPPAPEV